MRQLLKKLPVLIFIILHFSFILAAFWENHVNPFAIIFLSVTGFLLACFYYKNHKLERSVFRRRDILLIVLTITGAMITYWMNKELELGIVLSAGITGLSSSFIPFINRRSDILRELPAAIYCGAFAGMTAPFIAKGYIFIFFAGLFTGLILIISKSTLHGYGGKLGTVAFGGVSLMSFILFLFF